MPARTPENNEAGRIILAGGLAYPLVLAIGLAGAWYALGGFSPSLVEYSSSQAPLISPGTLPSINQWEREKFEDLNFLLKKIVKPSFLTDLNLDNLNDAQIAGFVGQFMVKTPTQEIDPQIRWSNIRLRPNQGLGLDVTIDLKDGITAQERILGYTLETDLVNNDVEELRPFIEILNRSGRRVLKLNRMREAVETVFDFPPGMSWSEPHLPDVQSVEGDVPQQISRLNSQGLVAVQATGRVLVGGLPLN